MQSAPLLPMCWSWQRKGTRRRNESPSFQMHRQLSGGWHRTNLALGNSMPSRCGAEAHHHPAQGEAGNRHRNPMVPSSQRSHWQWLGR